MPIIGPLSSFPNNKVFKGPVADNRFFNAKSNSGYGGKFSIGLACDKQSKLSRMRSNLHTRQVKCDKKHDAFCHKYKKTIKLLTKIL